MTNVYPHAVRFSALVKSVNTTAGVSTDKLAPFQMGVIDTKTWKTVSDASGLKSLRVVVGSPNIAKNPVSLTGFQDPFNREVSFKSMEIAAVKDFYTVGPKEAKPFIGYLGYNGLSTSTDTISMDCDDTAEFEVRVQGSIVEKLYGKFEIFERFSMSAPACDPCVAGDCDTTVDCGELTAQLVSQMNDPRNGFNKVARFGKFSAIRSCTTEPAVTTYAATKWELKVTDNGDNAALVAVKAGFAGLSIVRTSYEAGVSTYFICLDGVISPAAYTPTTSVSLAKCKVCPAGYTITSAKKIYEVARPLSGSENLSSSITKQAYADAVALAYYPASAAFDGTANVNAGTEEITLAAHGYATGDAVTYLKGAGTVITGLTDATVYYVIKVSANVIKLASSLANAIAGTAVNLTATASSATNTLKPVVVASFVSNTSAAAVVMLAGPGGITLGGALLADTLTLMTTEGEICVPTSPASIAWGNAGAAFKVRRSLKLVVKNEDCNGANPTILADMQALYAADATVVPGSVVMSTNGTCLSEFTMDQYCYNCLEDGCDTKGKWEAMYTMPQAFMGSNWSEVAPATTATDCKCGIKVESYVPGCDVTPGVAYDPTEYREYDVPVFEIYQVNMTVAQLATAPKFIVAQRPNYTVLDGHRVMHEIMTYRQYLLEPYTSVSAELGLKWKEAEGIVYGIDPCKKYYAIHLMGDYGETSSLSSSFGNKLEDIQLFVEDIATRDAVINLLSTFTEKPSIDMKVTYEK